MRCREGLTLHWTTRIPNLPVRVGHHGRRLPVFSRAIKGILIRLAESEVTPGQGHHVAYQLRLSMV
jgi:hypothetical protein